MAVFHCTFKSAVLSIAAQINIIIPEQCKEDIPTIYLYHGLSGDQDDWLRYTAIERYANDRSMAVVIPSVGKSYFSDMKYGRKYYTYVADELIDYTRRIFPLSRKREKTFVAGLSMGGYGALKVGLSKPEIFAAVASLSGVTDIHYRFSVGGDEVVAKSIWGENYLDELQNIDNNLYAMLKKIEEENLPKPDIFQFCGTEDFLYETNQRFRKYMEKRELVYVYREGSGAHTWDVWDKWITPAMDFFLESMKRSNVR